jgi:hypothetical protein
MGGLSQHTVARDEIVHVVLDGQIIQSPSTTIGKVESESIYVPRIHNHDHYPLKFQWGLF